MVDILTALIIFIMSIVGIPQIFKLIQRKKSDDISLITYVLVLVCNVYFVWYWIFHLNKILQGMSNTLGVITISIQIFLVIKYRK